MKYAVNKDVHTRSITLKRYLKSDVYELKYTLKMTYNRLNI